MAKSNQNSTNNSKLKLSLALDLRVVCIVLALMVVGMLLLWRPWTNTGTNTISVTGEAVIEETPDEYRFSPNFTATGSSTNDATREVNQIGSAVVAQLIDLGVVEEDIRTDIYAYEEFDGRRPAADDSSNRSYQATFTLNCKVNDNELAQKVTAYLSTTGAKGSLTPTVTFSEELRKSIDLRARERAIEDARTKAETQARELGLRLGNVVSVEESQGFGEVVPLGGSRSSADTVTSDQTLLFPGQQELRIKLTVRFKI